MEPFPLVIQMERTAYLLLLAVLRLPVILTVITRLI